MAYTYKKQLADRSNFGGARDASQIKYIVIHYTGNDGDSDEGNAKYFQKPLPPNRKASAHYFVDNNSVTQSVSDLYVAWSVGGNKYSDCSKTGGGKFYGKCTNANSINIELCDNLKNGVIEPSEATLSNAIILASELMRKYNIPLSNVIRHFDVTGKKCPEYFVEQSKWDNFLKMLGKASEKLKNNASNTSVSATITKGSNTANFEFYEVIAPSGLNVREGAGTSYKKLYALGQGDKFKVTEKSGQWFRGSDNMGRVGYAYAKWLRKLDM